MPSWCPYCFGELRADGVCPICAHERIDPDPNDLPAGTSIEARYVIGRVLGRGGFGITYLGWQQMPPRRVAIKEYLPQTIARRATDGSVVPSSRSVQAEFQQGLNAFGDEAQRLAEFQGHPHIVDVFDFVHAYGTAYMVMQYCPGQTALEYLHTYGGRLSIDDTISIVDPVLDALKILHARNVYHRDVSPDNILLTELGVKLIDFGAARIALREHSIAFSAILKMAYAPPEQYSRKGAQGPWTDVYATAATMYHLLTGAPPPSAMDRQIDDEIVPPTRKGAKITPRVERAIMDALTLDPTRRTQSAGAFQAALKATSGLHQAPAPRTDPKPLPPQPPGPTPGPPRGTGRRDRTWLWVAAALFLFVVVPLGALGVWLMWPSPPKIVAFQVEPEHTVAGQPVKIVWQTTGSTKVDIEPTENGVGLPTQGQLDVSPQSTTVYTLTAAGRGKSVSDTRTVTVDAPPEPVARRPANPDDGGPPVRRPEPGRNRAGEAKSALEVLVRGAEAAHPGFTVVDHTPGEIASNHYAAWPLDLKATHEYLFMAACDRDCKDLDLALRVKGESQPVSRDQGDDATPHVQYAPTADATFELIVTMAECASDPCKVHVVRLSKPKPQGTDR